MAKQLFLKKQDDDRDYNPLAGIKTFDIEDKVYLDNEFVPNEDVAKYFQVSDSIMLFYLTATPSGVESIGYNFNMPMLATNVGHFPETVVDGYNGYLAEDGDIESMAAAMIKSIETPIIRANVAETSLLERLVHIEMPAAVSMIVGLSTKNRKIFRSFCVKASLIFIAS